MGLENSVQNDTVCAILSLVRLLCAVFDFVRGSGFVFGHVNVLFCACWCDKCHKGLDFEGVSFEIAGQKEFPKSFVGIG